jgi:nucleotide-binding universal stress UspA family protein
MPHRILLPLDGSDLAERAVGWADVLAGALDADIEMLEVLPLLPEWEGPPPDITGPESEAIQQARRLLSGSTRASGLTLRGQPGETIADRAESTGATLVVMSSHGRSGLGRAVLGSVASDVLRDSRIPVLIVPAAADLEPRVPTTALFPLDDSAYARTVLDWSRPMIDALGTSIILYGVADLPPQAIAVQGAAIPLPSGPVVTPVALTSYLEGIAGELRGAGRVVEVQVGVGDPAAAIGDAADDAGVDLIVMSTHGRHGLARWALGSITEAVIQRAGVPVLACHPAEDRRAD